MYLPRADFESFIDAFQSQYDTAHCSMRDGSCYFPRGCDKVDTLDLQIKVRLFDFLNARFDIILDIKDLLVWGDELGHSDDRCYVPVFMSADTNPKDKWYFGNIIMENYYVAFDMTPYEQKHDYL